MARHSGTCDWSFLEVKFEGVRKTKAGQFIHTTTTAVLLLLTVPHFENQSTIYHPHSSTLGQQVTEWLGPDQTHYGKVQFKYALAVAGQGRSKIIFGVFSYISNVKVT